MMIQRIHNSAHEAVCIQAIRQRVMREAEARLISAPSDRIARFVARQKAGE